jgi:hypothetical protein
MSYVSRTEELISLLKQMCDPIDMIDDDLCIECDRINGWEGFFILFFEELSYADVVWESLLIRIFE